MKRMKRWLGTMLSVMLAAGSLQVPVYAAETGETAVEAAVEEESIESEDGSEDEELEVDLVEEEPAEESTGDMDSAVDDVKEEVEDEVIEDAETIETTSDQTEYDDQSSAEADDTEQDAHAEDTFQNSDVEAPTNSVDSEIIDEASNELAIDKAYAIDYSDAIGAIWLNDIVPVETSGYYYYDDSQIEDIERPGYTCAVNFEASYNSSTKLELYGLYDSFSGTVCTGVNTGLGVFTISIYGDGHLIHEISDVSHESNNYTLFNVDVSGVKELEIKSENSGDGAYGRVYIADGLLVKNQDDNGIPDLERQGHVYRVITQTASFEQAEEECEAIGGHLATIMSAEENKAITQYLWTFYWGGSYMIGLCDAAGPDGQWDTWVTGDPVTYSNWGSGQPDWEGQTICAINTEANTSYGWDVGEWDNGWDGDYHFICEWDDPDDLFKEIIEIHTAEELKNVSNNLSGHYKLMEDINLSALGEDWVPIGNDDPFTGKFDGNGHSINNIRIDNDEYYQGLFGITDGAIIKKLSVSGVINGGTFVGGIVGLCQNTVLAYCINNAIVGGTEQIGGVVGRLAEGSINYCMNTATVTASTRGCGGIVGDIYPSGSVTNCLSLGDVSGGTDLTGGISGGSTNGYVDSCVNAGKVSYQKGRVGAIAGDNASYAGERENNYFLQNEEINTGYGVVGSESGTFASRTDERVTGLKEKILSGCGIADSPILILKDQYALYEGKPQEIIVKANIKSINVIPNAYNMAWEIGAQSGTTVAPGNISVNGGPIDYDVEYTATYSGTGEYRIRAILYNYNNEESEQKIAEATAKLFILDLHSVENPRVIDSFRGISIAWDEVEDAEQYELTLMVSHTDEDGKQSTYKVDPILTSNTTYTYSNSTVQPGDIVTVEIVPIAHGLQGIATTINDILIQDDYFVIGRDSNSFLHTSINFAASTIGEGRIGTSYPTTLYYYNKLIEGLSYSETVELMDKMNRRNGWGGACQGLNVSLAMSYLQKLNISNFRSSTDSTPKCFNDLLAPVNNSLELRDLIHYYQLLQYVGKAKHKKQVINLEDWGIFNNIMTSLVTLPSFWKNFAEDVKAANSKQIPLLFHLGYGNEGGHTLLTCGYNENDQYYIIKFYDPNYSCPAHEDADYIYLFISKETSQFWFSFSDTSIVPCNVYSRNDYWTDFAYYGSDIWDKIEGETELDNSSKSSSPKLAVSGVNNTFMYFTVAAEAPFRLQNGRGQYLERTDNGLQGTLNVYDIEIFGDSADYRFKLDYNENYSVTDYNNGTELCFRTDTNYASIITQGAEKTSFLEGKKIIFDGDSISYDVRLSMNSKEGLIGLSGTATDNAVINHNDGEIIIEQNGSSEIEVEAYDAEGNTSFDVINGTGSIIIDENGSDNNIENFEVTLSNEREVYTGKEQKPTIVIKDSSQTLIEQKDYKVQYESNISPGIATITITGIGSYTGTVTKTFTILPGKTTRGDMFNLANNVKVTWKEVPGAKYYKVYREGITDKKETQKEPVIVTERLVGWDSQPGLTNGHAYRYRIVASLTGKGDSSGDSTLSYSKVMYRLKTVVIRSVKNTAPGKVTVKYDKTNSGDSYVLQYCERQDMVGAKTKVVLGANNTSYTIGGLKKGKTYYISIRVRKKVNGIDYYTTFGVPKKVTITK